MRTTTWEMVTRAIETGIVGYHKKLLHDQAFGVGRARAVYQGQVQCGTTAVVHGPSRAFDCILEASYWSLSYAAWKQTLICTGTLCAHWDVGTCVGAPVLRPEGVQLHHLCPRSPTNYPMSTCPCCHSVCRGALYPPCEGCGCLQRFALTGILSSRGSP
jgi:hypothetical protein